MKWIKKFLLYIFRFLPMRDDIVLESHPDFSDNTYALYCTFVERGITRRHHIYWLVRDPESELVRTQNLPENVSVIPRESRGLRQELKRLSVLYRSRYIFDSNSYVKKRRKNQVRIHLGHGMPIKYVPDYTNWKKIGECDGYLVLGKSWEDFYVNKAGLPQEVLLPLGYPRNDILCKGVYGKREKERFIFWMPTYRQHRNHTIQTETRYPFGMPEVAGEKELELLNDKCGQWGLKIFFRPHPAQDLSLMKTVHLSHIIIADDEFLRRRGCTLYELLGQSLGLITDYSSVYFDYLLTEMPIGLTMSDREDFFSHNSCAFENLAESVKGFYIEDFGDLLDFVELAACFLDKKEPSSQKLCEELERQKLNLKEMRERYHDKISGNSCELLSDYLHDRLRLDGLKIEK